ncbi:MAG: 16S rRNA (adenine(1518)-N(6)/adenine(1519)-N(6))-dimethyltransferase RsmA [Aerococcus sp.]|nr:16S rRNA (adenine(1518)-N(6)/adenine(1519)-N(6))-dimethyltransferase RsmA [Aerococcus sp.]
MTKKWIATPSRTNAILKRYNLDAKKSLGQNFLMEPQVLMDMVNAASIDETTDVIEIGPGIGALTEFLATHAQRVLAYELDDRLLPVLADELGDFANLTVKHQDILKADITADIQEQFPSSERLAVVANLPYYITTPILFHLLEASDQIKTYALMMQLEVAERLIAKPGTKAYGAVTVAIQYYCDATIATHVPRTVFKPRPNVDSAVLLLERLAKPRVEVADERLFFTVVRGSFQHRRKTLWNNLRGLFGKDPDITEALETALAAVNIDPKRRAETLTIEEFAALVNQLSADARIVKPTA